MGWSSCYACSLREVCIKCQDNKRVNRRLDEAEQVEARDPALNNGYVDESKKRKTREESDPEASIRKRKHVKSLTASAPAKDMKKRSVKYYAVYSSVSNLRQGIGR